MSEPTDPMTIPARAILAKILHDTESDAVVALIANALRAAEEAGHARGVRDQELATRGNR